MNPIRLATCVAVLSVPCVAEPAERDISRITVSVSGAYVQDRYGPYALELAPVGNSQAEARRKEPTYERSLSPIAIDVGIHLWRGVGVELTAFLSDAAVSRNEEWIVLFDPPPDDPLPTVTNVDVRTESRAMSLAATYSRNLIRNLELSAKVGALRTDRETVVMQASPGNVDRDEFKESDTRLWLGGGARYTIYRGLSLSAEYGWAKDGYRSARVGIGWTFEQSRKP